MYLHTIFGSDYLVLFYGGAYKVGPTVHTKTNIFRYFFNWQTLILFTMAPRNMSPGNGLELCESSVVTPLCLISAHDPRHHQSAVSGRTDRSLQRPPSKGS